MKLTFLGAAETVTGSRFLVENDSSRILVDCGLFQGLKKLRLLNREAFPVDPASLDAVVLTHAHIDHSGYIPALVKNGFSGPVYCTPATLALCRILLPDAGHLQEEEAVYANKHGFSKHSPALPLFTEQDAGDCLGQFVAVPYDTGFNPVPEAEARFAYAGHILGSASVQLRLDDKNIVFSGDVGRPDDPVMYAPHPPGEADYLLVESTYGDRRHPDVDPKAILKSVINETAEQGGVVMIPSFAVGRTQTILYLISELISESSIPELPVFLDSPMAIDTTELFCQFHDEHRLSKATCERMCGHVIYTRSVDESKAIADYKEPKIIVSASGMLSGGRILHHMKEYLPDAKNSLVFVGYQAAGTRGAAMLSGIDSVKIHGQYHAVKARLASIDAFSAHADYVELADWLSNIERPPRQTFIVHGEPQGQDAFRRYLGDKLGWKTSIPVYKESFNFD